MDTIASFLSDHIFIWSNFERIFSSIIFLFIALFLLRPKIKISTEIANSNFDTSNDNNEFLFKIMNKSIFSCYQVEAKAIRLTPYVVTGGTNFRMSNIKLRTEQLGAISKYSWFDKHAFYAIVLVTDEDLIPILNDINSKIMLEITAKHGLSGISRTFSKEYSTSACIKNGQFTFGNSLDIK